jgi:flagellar protein FlaF
MAGAEIIGAAIGVLLLVLVGYIMVGSTLSSAEIVASAQKELTLRNEAALRTSITISSPKISSSYFNFSLNNTGNEVIGDFTHMDIFSWDGVSTGYQRYTYNQSGDIGTWKIEKIDPDFIHPKMLDPGEAMWIRATFTPDTPTWILITTSNGVFTSRYI